MAEPSLPRTFIREVFSFSQVPRVPEPDLVMDDPEKVAAYTRAGREDGVMAPVYLFHCAQISEILRPGDTAVDLACGPATQLAMVARLNPAVNFTGVDLSSEMLARARSHLDEERLTNVDLKAGDISRLAGFADDSVDAVFSTVALHHLPDLATLEATFAEIARILKPGGGVYLVDFGRLKSARSIDYFANQYADHQPELFTLDYLYSLRAAFTLDEFRQLAAKHLPDMQVSSTFLMPFMVAIKSQARAQVPGDDVIRGLEAFRSAMPAHHEVDLKNLKRLFRLGGMPSLALS